MSSTMPPHPDSVSDGCHPFNPRPMSLLILANGRCIPRRRYTIIRRSRIGTEVKPPNRVLSDVQNGFGITSPLRSLTLPEGILRLNA